VDPLKRASSYKLPFTPAVLPAAACQWLAACWLPAACLLRPALLACLFLLPAHSTATPSHLSSRLARSSHACDVGPIMKLLREPPWWGWCLLLQDIGVTRQAFQYDSKAWLSPASQPAAAVTRPLHSINL
jgi:hypothetical protein